MIPAEMAPTLLHAAVGVAVVVGTLVFLVGVCGANAWLVRLVESPKLRRSVAPVAVATSAPVAPTAPPSTPDHLLVVLAAAAAHILEKEIHSIEILDVHPYSPWKLEGRLAIHRGRIVGKGLSVSAFPSGENRT